MIVSFADKDTERLSRGERVKAFESFARTARIKLNRLDASETLAFLAGSTGDRLEKLRGDRDGQWSIRINDQWRICFQWDDDAKGFANVEIVDYH